jgi:surfeit locus 1 family protein
MREEIHPLTGLNRRKNTWNGLLLFHRRWLLATLMVLAAMGVMVRLGIWQLDRLAQRRAFNAHVNSQINQPTLVLNASSITKNLPDMEYHQVVASGHYDLSQQVALRNQAYQNEWGVHLLTPLMIDGTNQAILVDRGWIPGEDYQSGNSNKYDEPGPVMVRGVIRTAQTKPDFGRRNDPPLQPGQTRLESWNFVNVGRIAEQIPYKILAVYIQAAPENSHPGLPYRSLQQLDLSEGPHMGYALQWFTFALMLGIGYPFFVKRRANARNKNS